MLFDPFKMAVEFFKTASTFPNFDDSNAFFPNSTSPWPRLQKGRKIIGYLNFGLSLNLHPYFVYAESEGSSQSNHCAGSPEPQLLKKAKYQNLMCCLIYTGLVYNGSDRKNI